MNKALKIILMIILSLTAAGYATWFYYFKPAPPLLSDADRAMNNIIPLPSEMSFGKGRFIIKEDLGTTFQGIKTERLEKALFRFHSRIEKSNSNYNLKVNGDRILIECATETGPYPVLGADESYSLKITNNNIIIKAPEETGVLHALESLYQLLSKEDDIWYFPEVEIKDQPRFAWRGILIDEGRHFISKKVILENLNAMAAVKMNVLHWHLSEYQGFRVESKVFPKLHEMGSNGEYYTQEEIKEIINYAADRGIRVMPEFDLPGHSTSWLVGYPELASAPGPYSVDTVIGVLLPVMDPSNPKVYEFLDSFFEEMATLFPEEYVHIGGDEVKPNHWNENEDIQTFMKSEGIKDNHELQAYFNQRLHKILEDKGKKMMGWDEIIHPNLPKEGMVVQAWRNQKSLWEAARNGYKAVLSNGYYLDYKQSAGKHYSVDPFVIPGAISIEVDESNWKSWKGQMVRDETKVDMEIYLFGEGDLRRGIVKTMEGTSSFENPVFENNKFEFSIESNFGKINFDLIFNGDEITGTAGISVFKLDVDGLRNGGSDMENGAVLPKFEKIEPLTPEEEKNILGGEACMWSEMVDSVTILSRIWPRAAAVAEKMWTPEQTSKDTEDMYRRIELFDNRLSEIGLDYTSRQRRILEEISGDQGIGLFSLVESLQEDMFFNRMSIYDPEFYVTTPLNRMVDAILPESYEAYNFNILAREMKENDPDGKKKNYVQLKLMNWKNLKLDANLKNADERLKEILPQIDRVSTLAGYAYKKLNGEQLSSKEMDSIDSLLTVSEEAVGGTKIAILDGLIAVLKD